LPSRGAIAAFSILVLPHSDQEILADLLLRFEAIAVTKPTFKLVATGATQRK
jgi:hypothetical protein